MQQLIGAAQSGVFNEIERCLPHVTNLDASDEHGVTALMSAAFCGHASVVRRLLRAGAGADVPSPQSTFTPLLAACQNGHIEAARALIEAGADVNVPERNLLQSPLVKSTEKNHFAIVALLLEAGARVEQRKIDGATALYVGAQYGSVDSLRLLIAAGADVNMRFGERFSPLSIAVSRDRVSAVKQSPRLRYFPPCARRTSVRSCSRASPIFCSAPRSTRLSPTPRAAASLPPPLCVAACARTRAVGRRGGPAAAADDAHAVARVARLQARGHACVGSPSNDNKEEEENGENEKRILAMSHLASASSVRGSEGRARRCERVAAPSRIAAARAASQRAASSRSR